jgi:hypothetical protein
VSQPKTNTIQDDFTIDRLKHKLSKNNTTKVFLLKKCVLEMMNSPKNRRVVLFKEVVNLKTILCFVQWADSDIIKSNKQRCNTNSNNPIKSIYRYTMPSWIMGCKFLEGLFALLRMTFAFLLYCSHRLCRL